MRNMSPIDGDNAELVVSTRFFELFLIAMTIGYCFEELMNSIDMF